MSKPTFRQWLLGEVRRFGRWIVRELRSFWQDFVDLPKWLRGLKRGDVELQLGMLLLVSALAGSFIVAISPQFLPLGWIYAYFGVFAIIGIMLLLHAIYLDEVMKQ